VIRGEVVTLKKLQVLLLASLLTVYVSDAYSQSIGRTIPQSLAAAGTSLNGAVTTPSGPAPSMDIVVRQTDVILSGIIGESRSYLSKDQREVYTDYTILKPVFLYSRSLVTSSKPEIPRETLVTLAGGTISINGLTFTLIHQALPSLEPNTECLFLLKRVDDKYHIVETYYGAFSIADGKLHPLAKKWGFAREYENVSAVVAVAAIVDRVNTSK
jgi:hypothetical protein